MKKLCGFAFVVCAVAASLPPHGLGAAICAGFAAMNLLFYMEEK